MAAGGFGYGSTMTMPYSFARRSGTVELRFVHEDDLDDAPDPLRKDLSASVAVGNCLFVASDEGATIERLVRVGTNEYAEHSDIALDDFFDLPDGRDGEMDVEGLAVDGGYLWITGSHSLKRNTPDADDELADQLADLDDIDSDPNRSFIGRIPLRYLDDGSVELVKKIKHHGATLRAGRVKQKKDGSTALLRHVRKDVHFGPFIDVPSKENGFDVEGLGVIGPHVFLGLRGPVLRGWAIVLELDMKQTGKRAIKPRRFPDGRRYRKHFLDLDGLGVRDLVFDGDDLLVLAGPTMDLHGPFCIYRWSDPRSLDSDSVTPTGNVEKVMDLPFEPKYDHAEALALLDADRLFVAHDDPHPDRLVGTSGLLADVYDLGAIDDSPITAEHAGGGYYDVAVWGIVVDRVQGRDAAGVRVSELEDVAGGV